MSVHTDSHSTRVLWSDGRPMDTGDLNLMGHLLQTQLLENMLLSGVSDAVDDETTPGSVVELQGSLEVNLAGPGAGIYPELAFAPVPGAASVRPHPSTANTLLVGDGPIMQVIDEPFNGTNEAVAIFRLPRNATFATAVGDATNPRIDILEMKLEFINNGNATRHFEDAVTRAKSSTAADFKRSVQCTLQIKQGTPAATPAYPALTAGFCALAAIRVPATHNAVHSADNLRDMRVPLGGMRPYDVLPTEAWLPGANPWVLTHGNPALAAELTGPAASTGEAFFVCPCPSKIARLMSVGIYSRNANSARLVAIDHNYPAAPTVTTLADLSGGSFSLVGAAGYRAASMLQLGIECGAAGAPATHVGTRPAGTRLVTPMWASGYPAGIGRRLAAFPETPHRQLAVGVTGASTDQLAFVRFVLAHGIV